jgi:hypothetical protein
MSFLWCISKDKASASSRNRWVVFDKQKSKSLRDQRKHEYWNKKSNHADCFFDMRNCPLQICCSETFLGKFMAAHSLKKIISFTKEIDIASQQSTFPPNTFGRPSFVYTSIMVLYHFFMFLNVKMFLKWSLWITWRQVLKNYFQKCFHAWQTHWNWCI